MLKAVRQHTDCCWVLLYVERLLKAPVQMEDGSIVPRTESTGLVRALSSGEPASLCALGLMPWQRLNIGSRVNREVHARFWERLAVKVRLATRQTQPLRACARTLPARQLIPRFRTRVVCIREIVRDVPDAGQPLNKVELCDRGRTVAVRRLANQDTIAQTSASFRRRVRRATILFRQRARRTILALPQVQL